MAARTYYGSADQADGVFEKIRHPRSLWIVARNIVNYHRGIPRIAGVVTLGIEPSFGCNLRCSYCWGKFEKALQGRRPPLMDWDLFTRAIDQAPATVESVTLGCLGEPLLNPRTPDMIDYIVRSGRRACMYTNGMLLDGERMRRLAAAPLSTLNISVEPDPATSLEFRGADYARILENAREYAAARVNSNEIQLSVVLHPGNTGRMESLRRDWAGLSARIKVSPLILADACAVRQSCSEVWRGNMVVFTDGSVSPCCVDLFGELEIGNLRKQTFQEIINGERFARMLDDFAHGRMPARCLKCAEVPIHEGLVRFPKRAARKGAAQPPRETIPDKASSPDNKAGNL
jgi:radical SAM protein with 4Fe4S-binding SPASM domain